MNVNNAKRRVITASLLTILTTTAFAESKIYIGEQLGYGKTGVESGLNDSGLAGRLFAGYQFNPYFSTELGWTKFSNVTKSERDDWGLLTTDFTARTDALDLLGKATYPMTSNLDIYGKLGVAYAMQSYKISNKMWDSVTLNEYAWLPTFGFGGTYHFTPKVGLDASYSRIQHVGNTTIASSDFLGVGFSYSFS